MARPSETGSRASTEPASRLGPMGFDPARELLGKVLAFYEGRKPYDFHHIRNAEVRGNAADDAMQELAVEMRAVLGAARP